ncbi:MAG TPA: hypothetical protein VI322_02135 [Candidatus Saccharimonadia bacterium]
MPEDLPQPPLAQPGTTVVSDGASEQPVEPPAEMSIADAGSQLSPPAEDDDEPTYSPEELEQLRATEVAFRWQASEYVHHQKSAQWYFMVVVVLVIMVSVAVIFHYWLEIGLFCVTALAVVIYARKPPRVLTYEVSPQGISIDGRLHPYAEFKSFGVIPDLEWHTVDLEPAARFSPRVSILFDEQDIDEIVGHMELHLPRVDRNPDVIDRFSRYVRF